MKQWWILLVVLLGACAGRAQNSGRDPSPHVEAPRDDQLDHQLELMKRLISAVEPSDPDYAEFLLRLGEMYQAYRDFYVDEASKRQEQLRAMGAGAVPEQRRALTAELRACDREARAMAEDATKVFAVLIDEDEFRTFERRGEVFASLIDELNRLGRHEEAAEYQARENRRNEDLAGPAIEPILLPDDPPVLH